MKTLSVSLEIRKLLIVGGLLKPVIIQPGTIANYEFSIQATSPARTVVNLKIYKNNFFFRKDHCTNCLQIRQQLHIDPGFGHLQSIIDNQTKSLVSR